MQPFMGLERSATIRWFLTGEYIDIMWRTYDFQHLRSAQINKELSSMVLLS